MRTRDEIQKDIDRLAGIARGLKLDLESRMSPQQYSDRVRGLDQVYAQIGRLIVEEQERMAREAA
jgi:hypothetical protein